MAKIKRCLNQEQQKQYEEVRERIAIVIYDYKVKWDRFYGGEDVDVPSANSITDQILSDPSILIKEKDQRWPNVAFYGIRMGKNIITEYIKRLIEAGFVKAFSAPKKEVNE